MGEACRSHGAENPRCRSLSGVRATHCEALGEAEEQIRTWTAQTKNTERERERQRERERPVAMNVFFFVRRTFFLSPILWLTAILGSLRPVSGGFP